MAQFTNENLIDFLDKEGYELNSSICDEKELAIYDCWHKKNCPKIRVRKKTIFQISELSQIFTPQMANKFKRYLNK